MSYRDGLTLVPEHMRASIAMWIEQGLPAPTHLGHFLRALLTNDLMGAFMHADAENSCAMRDWTLFLYNYAPAPCFGSMEKIQAWHDFHEKARADGETVK